jgi:hypothetical protein
MMNEKQMTFVGCSFLPQNNSSRSLRGRMTMNAVRERLFNVSRLSMKLVSPHSKMPLGLMRS